VDEATACHVSVRGEKAAEILAKGPGSQWIWATGERFRKYWQAVGSCWLAVLLLLLVAAVAVFVLTVAVPAF